MLTQAHLVANSFQKSKNCVVLDASVPLPQASEKSRISILLPLTLSYGLPCKVRRLQYENHSATCHGNNGKLLLFRNMFYHHFQYALCYKVRLAVLRHYCIHLVVIRFCRIVI